jgi:hypothetical protein
MCLENSLIFTELERITGEKQIFKKCGPFCTKFGRSFCRSTFYFALLELCVWAVGPSLQHWLIHSFTHNTKSVSFLCKKCTDLQPGKPEYSLVSSIVWPERREGESGDWGSLAIHCKKRLAIFPSPAGVSLTKLPLGGNNLIIPAKESLVSDILAGAENFANLFLRCTPLDCEGRVRRMVRLASPAAVSSHCRNFSIITVNKVYLALKHFVTLLRVISYLWVVQ